MRFPVQNPWGDCHGTQHLFHLHGWCMAPAYYDLRAYPCLSLEFPVLTTLDPFSFLNVPTSLHGRTLRPVFFLLVTPLPFPPLDPG